MLGLGANSLGQPVGAARALDRAALVDGVGEVEPVAVEADLLVRVVEARGDAHELAVALVEEEASVHWMKSLSSNLFRRSAVGRRRC